MRNSVKIGDESIRILMHALGAVMISDALKDPLVIAEIEVWLNNWIAKDYSCEGLKSKFMSAPEQHAIRLDQPWEGQQTYTWRGKEYFYPYLPPFDLIREGDSAALKLVPNFKMITPLEDWRDPFHEARQRYISKTGRDAFSWPHDVWPNGMWLPGLMSNTRGADYAVYGDDEIHHSSSEDCLFISPVKAAPNAKFNKCVFVGGLTVTGGATQGNIFEASDCVARTLSLRGVVIDQFTFGGKIIYPTAVTAEASSIVRFNAVGAGLSTIPLSGLFSLLHDLSLDDFVKSGKFDKQFNNLIKTVDAFCAIYLKEKDDPDNEKRHHHAKIEYAFSKLRSRFDRESLDYLSSRMHNYELRCREKNDRYSSLERTVSCGYRLFSGYGNSIGRPLMLLLSLWGLCAAVYTTAFNFARGSRLQIHDATWPKGIADGLSYSAGRIAPFIPWDNRVDYPPKSLEVSMRLMDGSLGLIVHLTSLGQTTLSALALFCLALACKRRFKVSDK
ncbi:hypothetical protein [Asticcacaulis excentricus]|uniref:Uncharacterized protein n=1 Tax=Asticcacaulis excentricus (strain ATCC 15261 / DSM 4724 / KCTC 12464 / NCIMB 9791 / VKM B-1370 / CB 48) TaxID=573065 RepID=E8RPS0_ASTEC|nr:hypothetical protein [Asticcacaulis excentricus]ADU12047.1 hypothetical protein Astex_0350 [Asticcacaulis excentricus CB 48]